MLVILALLAVVCFMGAAVLSALQILPPLATLHLVLAVGIMPLIAGAMTHFVPVLSRSATPPIAVRLLPLGFQLAGGIVFFSFVSSNQFYILGAVLALFAATLFGIWIIRRATLAVGKPHPCLNWYLAAITCLMLALLAVLVMALWPEQYAALRRLHLHLNVLGFIGLTAVATMQVLMPTVLASPDPQIAARLRQHLKWAFGGTVLVSLGAAWFAPLAYMGLLLWSVPLLQMGRAWLARYASGIFQRNGAVSSLAVAYAGLCVTFLFGALHAHGLLNSQHATLAFILIFLLPLVTGAVSQLLPVWIRPGVQADWHEQVRRKLGAGGAYRAMLFLPGGVLVGLGWRSGLLLSIAALFSFVWQFIAAMRRDVLKIEAKNKKFTKG